MAGHEPGGIGGQEDGRAHQLLDAAEAFHRRPHQELLPARPFQQLRVHVAGADVVSGTLNVGAYRDAASQVTRDFGPSIVAITLRESLSASDNGWSGVLWDGASSTLHESQRYVVRLVDRIGGGDSFAAGLIYSLVTGRPHDQALRFAVAASALKQTIYGDFNRVSVAEVDALAKGDASGRVQR